MSDRLPGVVQDSSGSEWLQAQVLDVCADQLQSLVDLDRKRLRGAAIRSLFKLNEALDHPKQCGPGGADRGEVTDESFKCLRSGERVVEAVANWTHGEHTGPGEGLTLVGDVALREGGRGSDRRNAQGPFRR
jgi:hypothetical protein